MSDRTRPLGGDKTVPLGAETVPLGEREVLPELGLPENYLIAGRYRMVRRLGQGGQADAFLCADQQCGGAPVVVKVYRSTMRVQPPVLEKLRQLRHRHLLAVLDHATLDGRFVEVDEYAAGGTLASHWPQRIEEERLTKVILPQVLDALVFLHGRGLIHRDLKPENIYFRDEACSSVALGDFGYMSLLPEGVSTRLSEHRAITFSYSAPELYSGSLPGADKQAFGRGADFFSLGMTLIALLKGEDPFLRATVQEVFMTVVAGEVPLPRCSERFQDLLRGLLHPAPRQRWGTEQVQRWLRGERVAVASYQGQKLATSFRYTLGPGLEATSPAELGRLLHNHPAEALSHVKNDILVPGIIPHDQALANTLRQAINAARSHEQAVLAVVYTLDPTLPYRLLPGKEARTPQELARLIDTDRDTWGAGRDQLYNQRILAWLQATGREGIGRQWSDVAAQYADQKHRDAGLEYFLHLLAPGLAWPTLDVSRTQLFLTRLRPGEQGRAELTIRNTGRGYLAGTVSLEDGATGMSLSTQSFGLLHGESAQVVLLVDTKHLERGRSYSPEICITSNAR